MTTNDAAAIVRRFFEEGWNGGSADPVADIIHDKYTSNDGPKDFAQHLNIYRQLYDGLHFTIERMILDGDATVVTIWTATGTIRNRTFTSRGGEEIPFKLRGQGLSLSEIVDSKVRKHDMFWSRDPRFP